MGGEDGDHGERVPELVYEFTTGLGNWSGTEQSIAEVSSSNIEDRLGVPVEPRAKEATTLFEEQEYDAREAHLYSGGNTPSPAALDPSYLIDLYHIRYAGAEDGYNDPQYHSCEYSDLAEERRFATDPEENDRLVQEIFEVFSDDIALITLAPMVGYGTFNTDHIVVDEDLLGEMGPGGYNYNFWYDMETKGDITPAVNVSTGVLNTNVHPLLGNTIDHGYWVNTIYSTLFKFNQNYELEPDLVEDQEVTDEFQTVTFTLKDHTFTNGDPVTAEDVKYTWELYEGPHDGLTGSAHTTDFESIDVIDERTIQFNFPVPTPGFMDSGGIIYYGILPKDLWEEKGAPENLSEMDLDNDEVIGSGPYELENFERDTFLSLTPNEDHYNTPNQGLTLRTYTDGQAAFRAYQEGDISIFFNPSVQQFREIEEEDNKYTETSESFMTSYISPQMSYAPFQFREFRLAVSQAIDRRELNQVAMYGDSSPMLHSCPYAPQHPFYPDDHEGLTKIAPSKAGSEEVARETLAEAGYTWDSSGRLRYPEDKDLTPEWPQGEAPMDHPDEWPCVETIPEGY